MSAEVERLAILINDLVAAGRVEFVEPPPGEPMAHACAADDDAAEVLIAFLEELRKERAS